MGDRELESRGAFIPVGAPFMPIDALRRNIEFYQNELQRLQQQERAYNLSQLTTAVGRFRRNLIANPIVRRRTDNARPNYRIRGYFYSFPRGLFDFVYMNNAVRQIQYIGNQQGVQTQIILTPYPVSASIDDHLGETSMKTRFLNTPELSLDEIMRKYIANLENYEDDLVIRTLIIRFLTPTNNLVIGQGGSRSEKTANNTWLIIDRKARTNCFYNCIATTRICERKQNESIEDYRDRIKKFVSNIEYRNEKISVAGRNLKRNFNPNITNFTDINIIKKYCNYTKSNNNQKTYSVKLYNNVFECFKIIHNDQLQTQIDEIENSNLLDEDAKKRGIAICLRQVKILEIQYIKNHFIPLIRWKDLPISKIIDEEEFKPVLDDTKDTTEIIKKYNKVKEYDSKIGAYDLEATPNGVPYFTTFCSSLAWWCIETSSKHSKIFYGLDSCKQLIDFIYSQQEYFNGYTFYAHNNGKFDMLLMFKDYILSNPDCPYKIANDSERKTICLNSAYIGVCLYTEEGNEIFFKDSLKLLPMPLAKLGQELKVEHQKLDWVVLPNGDRVNIDHDQINIQNWDTYEVRESQKIYCEQDSMCLLEALLIFSKEVYGDTEINITDCFTGASLSKKHFYNNYYNQNEYPLYSLSRTLDDFHRKSYYGGRNEAFFIGEYIGKIYYVDFTSLYPDVGRRLLPYGKPKLLKPHKITRLNRDLENTLGDSLSAVSRRIPFGFYKCLVRTKNTNIKPLHAIKYKGKLTFPIFDTWTEITLFSEELKLGYERDIYEYEIIKGFEYRKATFMKDFFNDGFTRKAEAKANDNPALAQSYKIIINSGYGFFGLNTLGKDKEGREGVEIWEGNSMSFWEAYNNQGIVNIGSVGDYTILRAKKELEISDFNVAVASGITSWARIKIWSFMTDMEEKGARVLYCDTDSAIMTKSMKEFPDIMSKYCWDGTGDELGSMKNEADDEVKDHYKDAIKGELLREGYTKDYLKSDEGTALVKSKTKELFKLQQEYEVIEDTDGNIHHDISWDRFIGGGCKQYALDKKLLDLKHIQICKMKGYKSKGENGKKLKYNQFQDLLKAKDLRDRNEEVVSELIHEGATSTEILAKIEELSIRQNQVQFRSPLTYHISENIGCVIEKTQIEKAFRINYTKGIVEDDGWVSPLRL